VFGHGVDVQISASDFSSLYWWKTADAKATKMLRFFQASKWLWLFFSIGAYFQEEEK
jgi:hypothetical protein